MTGSRRTAQGVIFNIQKFSVNDGPGIRTVVFLKGCPLRCRWCANPESQLAKPQILRNQSICTSCGRCREICPAHAVTIDSTGVHTDHNQCSSCGICVRECPMHALKQEGEYRTVQEVMDIVLQDQVFYEESGGGITLSGGELLAQPEFASELLKAAKEEGLNTCCETTGFAKPEVFQEVLPYLDFILFDLKHWDREKHLKYTGCSNALPAENMRYAVQSGKDVLPRIPVIPGFNNALSDAGKFAQYLLQIGIRRCQLLPFHQFGENKYSLLDRDYAYQDINALHREDLQEYLQVMKDHGIDAFF